MAGVNDKISVVVDILGNISNFQNSVKTMQNELNKLHLSNGVKDSFTQIFSELEREIGKIQTIGSKKKIELIDSKALSKSFANVEGLYNKLINKMQTSGVKNSLFEKDYQSIQKINSLMKSYDAAINKTNRSMSGLNGQVTRQTNELKKLQSGEGFTIVSDTEYTEALNKIDELKKAANEAKKETQKAEGTNEYEAALNRQVKITKELKNEQDKLKTITTHDKLAEDIEKVTQALERAKQNVAEFEQKNQQDKTQAWDNLISELQKIESIDWQRFGIDPSTIKSVEDLDKALAQITERSTIDAAESYNRMSTAAQNMGNNLEEVGRKAEQTAQSLMDLGDRQRDIQQLASRLTHFFSLTNQFMIMRRIIQNAITTIKELDKAMTETAVVTDFNVADMWAQLPEYTKVANELGATTKGAYETMTLFYQQGLNQQQAFQLGTETMKMARIAGLDYAEATDRMTNALRGFNMELNDVSSQRVNDVYSNLAAKSASNVDELSTAMTKTASIAHAANMEFETTAAFLAQIIETTRESAETAGTALKTVIARFSEVKKLYSEGQLTGQDEEGEEIDVNRVSTALRAAGINLNEYLTGAKGLDEIFIELSSKWNSLDLVTQRYIATMAAGSRQQSRFIALMQDYDRQTELLGYAQNAAGASTEQFNKTLDSLESKLNKLENAWNEFTMGIANSSMIKGAIDLITGLITAINKITNALGPVGGAITKVLLLFGGFKGIRVLFDKFVGHIAKVYIDIARKAGVAGMGAGEAYSKGFLTSSKAALNKFKGIFVNVVDTKASEAAFKSASDTLIQFNKTQSDIAKNTQLNTEVILGEAAAQDTLNQKKNEAILANLAGQDAEKAKLALDQLGIQNDVLRNSLLKGQVSAKELLAHATDEETLKTWLLNTAQKAHIDISEKDAAAEAHNIMMKKAQGLASMSLVGKIGAVIGVLFGQTTATEVLTAAEEKGIIVTDGFAAALQTLQKVAPFLWIIAAAIAAISFAMKVAEENSFANKMNDLESVSKSLNEELQNIQDTLDNFDEHTDKIKELETLLNSATIGTQEWRDAVVELNNEYVELSRVLGGDFWKHASINNGRIELDSAYLDQARSGLTDKQINLQNQTYANDAAKALLRLEEATSKIAAKAFTTEKASISNVEETQITSVNQSKLASQVKQLSQDELRNIYGASSIEELNQAIGKLGIQFQTSSNIDQIKTELEDYFNTVNEVTTQVDSTFKLLGSNLESSTINADAYSKVIQGVYKNAYKSAEDWGATGDIFGASSDIKQRYADVMNKSYPNRNYNVGFWGDIKYTDDQGETQTDDISVSAMIERIVADSLANADLKSEYQSVLNEMAKELENTKVNKSILEKVLAGDYNYEDVKELGPKAWTAIDAVFKEHGIDVPINPVLKQEVSDAIITQIEDLIAEANLNITANDLLRITNQKGINAFTNLVQNKTTSNKSQFADTFKSLGYYTDAEDFATVMEHLSSVDFDFSNKADWEALPKWLKDAGIEIPDSELQTFINKCEELAHAIDKIDFTKIEEQLGTLYSSLDKLRSGNIDATAINEDTYNALIDSGAVNSEDFRKNLATGEYVYIAGQDSLETAIYAAINALDRNAEAQLEANVKANEALGSLGENDLANLKTQLSSDSLDTQKYAIQRITDIWKNNNFDINSLGIDGLNSDTIISELSSDSASKISNAISGIILNGIDGAKAQQEAYQSNVDYTKAVDRGQQIGYSFTGNDTFSAAATETAFKSLENYDAQLQQTKEDYKELIGELDDNAWKKLTVDLADADKKGRKLAETFEKNKEALKDINSADYQTAFKELNSAMGDIFGKDVFDEGGEFLKENIDDILEYAETGSEETAEKIEQNIAARQLMIGLGLNAEPAMEAATEIANEIDGWEAEIDVTGYADVTDIINKFATTQEEIDAVARSIESMGDLEVQADVKMSSARLKITNLGKLNSAITDNVGGEAAAAALAKLNGANGATIEYPEMSYKVVKGKGSKLGNLRKGGGSGGGGGGGGGGSNKEPEDNRDWKNPYDKLYNAYAKLEELQRKRNNLEKEYDLLLGQAGKTSLDLSKELRKQTDNLKDQMAIQESIVAGKKDQIANAQNKTYSVEDNTVKSYAKAFEDAIKASNDAHGTSFSGNLSDYAKYNTSTEKMEIDWNQIQSLEGKIDSAAGEVLEGYISELEGLEDQYEEAQDSLLDIKADLKQIVYQQLENRVAFIEQMREAMIDEYQQQIDKLSALNDTINASNQRIFDSLQEQIDLDRQIRDNTKKEDEIANNEARLAYLQRDTSGANDLEIMKLQQTLDDQRQAYSDQLIDQNLQRLQDQADKAQEQREHQIELMDAQLQFWNDTGWWNKKIEAMSDTEAQALMEKFKKYKIATVDEQAAIRKEVTTLVQQGGNEAVKTSRELAAARSEAGNLTYKATYNGQTYDVKYNSKTGNWEGQKGNTKISIKEADATNVNNDKHTFTASAATLTDTSKKQSSSGTGNGGGGNSAAKKEEAPKETYPHGKASAGSRLLKRTKPLMTGEDVKAVQYALNKLGYTDNSGNALKVDGQYGDKTRAAVKKFQKAMGISDDGIVGKDTRAKFKTKGYATGGLADYTGPAWLDGTPSKPELVLNAKDTENFIQLKNILADVAKDSKNGSSGGDNYFDIKVEVGEIGSDYDVEKMITKIKDEIDQDARYRNVNSINFIR